MLRAEGICGCDVQLSAEFRAEIKASPHPKVLLCVMPTLKSSQRTWELQKCSSTGVRGSVAMPTIWVCSFLGDPSHAHPPWCVLVFGIPAMPTLWVCSCFGDPNLEGLEPALLLALWRELQQHLHPLPALGFSASPLAQDCFASRGENPQKPFTGGVRREGRRGAPST